MARFILLLVAAVLWIAHACGAHIGNISLVWLGAGLICLAYAIDGGVPFLRRPKA